MAEPKSTKEIIKKFGGLDRFKGFSRPNTTPTPDELFDLFLTGLTHAELKVLLYIVRRTFGFKKDADRISLSQIVRGIKTKHGKQLDRGAGVTKKTAILAIKRLEERGLIKVTRSRTEDGYNEVNLYRLRFQNEG
jgi:hypothetical protein